MQSARKEKYNYRGYAQGETRRLVIEAKELGLTIFDVMERSGKSYASIYNSCYRSGIKLKQRKNRAEYGIVKSLMFSSWSSVTTIDEVSKVSGLSIKTLRRAASHYRFKPWK
jgi:hypothetical protein